MAYTVKHLASLAGVSARTLHYYDEIGLLPPTRIGANGYRQYEEPDLLRLQQILFYRELGLKLDDIRSLLDTPGFDALAALRSHRQALRRKVERMGVLLQTVDRTIMHLEGERAMSDSEYFSGFDEAQQAEYEKEVVERWGADNPAYLQSKARWGRYSEARRREIIAEGQSITLALAELTDRSPADPEVQRWIERQHRWVNHFWDCSKEQFLALGEGYATDPGFSAMYARHHPDLPRFLQRAIKHYAESRG